MPCLTVSTLLRMPELVFMCLGALDGSRFHCTNHSSEIFSLKGVPEHETTGDIPHAAVFVHALRVLSILMVKIPFEDQSVQVC